MLAQPAPEMPRGSGWIYEPKWDGFRCLVFKDGDKLTLKSRNGKDLNRYFPELEEALLMLRAEKCVLDGEIVIPEGKGLSFDNLLQRIHPAKSRIEKLSRETPALLLVFDLLVDAQGNDVAALPLSDRRKRLVQFSERYLPAGGRVILSPFSTKYSDTKSWLKKSGNSLDGIIAKRADAPYLFGQREGMQKIKFKKTADCVVGGFRYASKKKVVGSLLLGLYDQHGDLDHVGFTSSLKAAEREEWLKRLEPLIGPPGFTGLAPGGPSRWATERTTEWVPLKTKIVVEVEFDHFTGGRFRHGTKLLRIRPDKNPKACSIRQVENESRGTLLILPQVKQSS